MKQVSIYRHLACKSKNFTWPCSSFQISWGNMINSLSPEGYVTLLSLFLAIDSILTEGIYVYTSS